MKKLNTVLWGVVFIIIGLIAGLNALDFTKINIFFDGWWSLFIIVPCTIGIFTDRKKMGNIIGAAIGVWLLLCAQGILEYKLLWKLALPIAIVALGVNMIYKSLVGDKKTEYIKRLKLDNGEVPNVTSAFSGQSVHFNGQFFKGAELNGIFGAVKCDLRDAVFTKDCVISASAVFGGVDILVPDNVNIKMRSNSFFGGMSNKAARNHKNNDVTLYIEGVCVFGGVDIK